ncbi:MAG: ATP-binding protein [Alphaproteobacteria bacterium]|nr:ATP-binding protein [Alphaproteobacteria bacterium]
MERFALRDLIKWKNRKDRKPLLLYGARQVGKTWLVREFARQHYKQLVELNFFTNDALKQIFANNISPDFLIEQMELLFNVKIDPNTTLLFFDEIQESQRAMDALKAFNDLKPECHIIAAGSFLGVATARQPVGQVNHLTLYPMSFCEFLKAINRNKLAQIIQNCDTDMLTIPVREMMENYLKKYFYVGGMPKAVQKYVDTGNLEEVRTIQNNLLSEYKGDFSKHIEKKDAPRVRMLWDSIPVHLFKENKKFIYKNVKQGGRAAEFETAMQWLVDTGLIYKIYRTETVKIPLSMHFMKDYFKIYMADIGLFCAKAGIKPADILLQGKDIVSDMYGALAEQFVLQELKGVNISSLYYWGRESPSKAEIDFITDINGGYVVPIEVKSAKNTKAKSLKVYIAENKPKYAVRTSLNQFRTTDGLYDIPLYMISQVDKLLNK